MTLKPLIVIIIALSLEFPDQIKTLNDQAQEGMEVTREIQDAIDKGLAFLVKTQNKNGSWGIQNCIAKTSMCCLAFMAGGNFLNRGKPEYSESLGKGLDYILNIKNAQKEGHFHDITNDYADVHNHGYALLLLSQVYGMGDVQTNKAIKEIAPKAIDLSFKAQCKHGGWGYGIKDNKYPNICDEGSCTVTQVQSLRCLKDAGFSIDREKLDKAIKYLQESCDSKTGGFIYGLNPRMIAHNCGRPAFAVTAAGVAILNSYGVYTDSGEKKLRDMMEKSLEYLDDWMKKGVHCFYYYGHFYAAQAFFRCGGNRWKEYWQRVSRELMKKQKTDGRWIGGDANDSGGYENMDVYGAPHMTTAFALMVLQIPNRSLPMWF